MYKRISSPTVIQFLFLFAISAFTFLCSTKLFAIHALMQNSCSFNVTTTADAGDGTLRQVLEDANAASDEDVICFNLPGDGPHTIQLESVLPAITEPGVIDGYTQPGASENTLEAGTDAVLMVELDGSNVGGENTSGLLITGDNITVRGLVINRFEGNGITISSGSNNLIEGNFIGTNVSGTNSAPNDDDGISLVEGASENEIRDNVLSGNDDDGLEMKDSGTSDNLVRDNLIGTDASGTAALPNEDDGVDLDSGAGDNLFLNNVISGNFDNGIDIQDPETTGNIFQGNLVGTDATGTAPLGNEDEGVDIEDNVRNTLFGGTKPGDGNVIAHNNGNGIEAEDIGSGSIAILGNSIYGNADLGVDLNSDGPTVNDPGDGDSGPNNLQNFPEIQHARVDDDDLLVTYFVDSEPGNSTYPLRTEFFLADISEQEGQIFLGFDEYEEADWSGCGSMPCTKTANFGPAADLGVEDGMTLLATATDAEDNTSEFSMVAFSVANEGYEFETDDIPVAYELSQNYPNPFNPQTNIRFGLPAASDVSLKVYDLLGKPVAVLVNDNLTAGHHSVDFDGSQLATGIYLYHIEAGQYQQVKKMLLIK